MHKNLWASRVTAHLWAAWEPFARICSAGPTDLPPGSDSSNFNQPGQPCKAKAKGAEESHFPSQFDKIGGGSTIA